MSRMVDVASGIVVMARQDVRAGAGSCLPGTFCSKLEGVEVLKYRSRPEANGIALKMRDDVDSGHRILQATTFCKMLVLVADTECLEIVTHRAARVLVSQQMIRRFAGST
jgi:hypothetical protein